MTKNELDLLIAGIAPVLVELVEKTVAPLREQVKAFETLLGSNLPALVAKHVAAAVDAIPRPRDGEPGRDADMAAVVESIAEEVARAVSALPPPAPAKDVDLTVLDALVANHVAAAVIALPRPRDGEPGRDVDMAAVTETIAEEVARAVSALPPPAPGKDVNPAEVERLIAARVEEAVSRLPPPEPGRDGAPGKLPMVEKWSDRVHLESEVVTHEGATWQALRHTGKAPPHEDWRCIARAGRDGEAGRGINVRSTWSATETYAANDLVALDGGSFVARRDDPGPCPGEGWQLVAMRGKPGKPGDKGERGDTVKGDRGPPGPGVVDLSIDDTGLVVLTNGDGSTVERDFSPVLSRLGH